MQIGERYEVVDNSEQDTVYVVSGKDANGRYWLSVEDGAYEGYAGDLIGFPDEAGFRVTLSDERSHIRGVIQLQRLSE